MAVFWLFSCQFFERFLKPVTNTTSGFPKNEVGFLRCKRSSGAAFTSLFGRFFAPLFFAPGFVIIQVCYHYRNNKNKNLNKNIIAPICEACMKPINGKSYN